jgi:hypothetical protein
MCVLSGWGRGGICAHTLTHKYPSPTPPNNHPHTHQTTHTHKHPKPTKQNPQITGRHQGQPRLPGNSTQLQPRRRARRQGLHRRGGWVHILMFVCMYMCVCVYVLTCDTTPPHTDDGRFDPNVYGSPLSLFLSRSVTHPPPPKTNTNTNQPQTKLCPPTHHIPYLVEELLQPYHQSLTHTHTHIHQQQNQTNNPNNSSPTQPSGGGAVAARAALPGRNPPPRHLRPPHHQGKGSGRSDDS